MIRKIPELEAYDDAYTKVERYLKSLRIENRRILSRLVYLILEKTAEIHSQNPKLDITTLAVKEAHELTSEWCAKVLDYHCDSMEGIPVKSRVAMLLSNIPSRWPRYFLSDTPLPEELIKTMRQAYLTAGPEFQISRMTHRALDFNPAAGLLAETYKLANRSQVFRWLIYIVIIGLFVTIFLMTRY